MSFTRSGGAAPPWYSAMPVVRVTSSYAAQVTDYYIGVNGTGVTVTLPPGATTYAGKTYVIKDESGLITPNSSYRFNITAPNLIDGSSSLTVTVSYAAITVLWTGSFWSII